MIEYIKKKKRIVFVAIAIVFILAATFFLQNSGEKPKANLEATSGLESSASAHTDSEELSGAGDQKVSSSETEEAKSSATSQQPAETNKVATNDTVTTSNKQAASIASEQQTKTVQKTDPETTTCSLGINCSAILNNLDKLTKGKEGLIPSDGSLLNLTKVKFEKGETVFDVLKRELKSRGMHLEFSKTPGIGTVYIEGICNLYEFDCGELSGWKYAVNGVFPNYSCSDYVLSDGDVITWEYTCG